MRIDLKIETGLSLERRSFERLAIDGRTIIQKWRSCRSLVEHWLTGL